MGVSMPTVPMERSTGPQEAEWAVLIAQTAQGDQDALAALYDCSSPHVYGLIYRILDNREAAEEVTLDVYTQVWRQAPTFDRTRGTPGAWLMTLARTRAIDRYRAGAMERGKLDSMDATSLFAGEEDDPEEAFAGLERRQLVRQALQTLSAEQREVIALAYFYGLSQSEIAEKLGQPLGTVKTRMRLGMIKLRDVLSPHGEGLLS